MSTSGIPPLNDQYIARFWSYVDIRDDDDCWNWTKARSRVKNPYGIFGVGSGTSYLAHRLSYYIYYGQWPRELHVAHRCDNGLCCNPKHLFLATHAENMKDRVSKERTSRGEEVGLSKLTETEVFWIYENMDKLKPIEMARLLKIDRSVISRIRRGLAWNHLYKEYFNESGIRK